MSSNVSGQHIRYIEDTLHYCLTEKFTKFLVSEHLENRINSDLIINLTKQNQSDSTQIKALERKLAAAADIELEQDSIIDLTEQDVELTEKELKRQKRRARWEKVWSWGKYVLIGAGSAGAGYAIGSLAH